jgi:hypothetical protein
MIIVYKEVKDGKIELTKEEFEQYLEQARKDGYDEGYRKGYESHIIMTPINTPTYTPIVTNKDYGVPIPNYKPPYDFTCTGTNVVDTGSTKIHVE